MMNQAELLASFLDMFLPEVDEPTQEEIAHEIALMEEMGMEAYIEELLSNEAA
jgi:hypothetical protein